MFGKLTTQTVVLLLHCLILHLLFCYQREMIEHVSVCTRASILPLEFS